MNSKYCWQVINGHIVGVDSWPSHETSNQSLHSCIDRVSYSGLLMVSLHNYLEIYIQHVQVLLNFHSLQFRMALIM